MSEPANTCVHVVPDEHGQFKGIRVPKLPESMTTAELFRDRGPCLYCGTYSTDPGKPWNQPCPNPSTDLHFDARDTSGPGWPE